jgi:hypothetical protein
MIADERPIWGNAVDVIFIPLKNSSAILKPTWRGAWVYVNAVHKASTYLDHISTFTSCELPIIHSKRRVTHNTEFSLCYVSLTSPPVAHMCFCFLLIPFEPINRNAVWTRGHSHWTSTGLTYINPSSTPKRWPCEYVEQKQHWRHSTWDSEV